jgi:hypothetical protein
VVKKSIASIDVRNDIGQYVAENKTGVSQPKVIKKKKRKRNKEKERKVYCYCFCRMLSILHMIRQIQLQQNPLDHVQHHHQLRKMQNQPEKSENIKDLHLQKIQLQR